MKHLTRTSFSLAAVALIQPGNNSFCWPRDTLAVKPTRPSALPTFPLTMAARCSRGAILWACSSPGRSGAWGPARRPPSTATRTCSLGTRGCRRENIFCWPNWLSPGNGSCWCRARRSDQYEPDAKIAEAPMQVDNVQDSVEEMVIKLSGHQGQGDPEVAGNLPSGGFLPCGSLAVC